MLGCFSHQPDALTCHPRRGKPAQDGRGGPPEAHKARHWPAVMTPRRVAQRADDVVAPRRAADGAILSIEGARAYAGATTRGAAGRFPRVRSESRSLKSFDTWLAIAHSSNPPQGKIKHRRGVFVTQKFGLPKLSPSQIGRNGKAQGQKAKGTEFEPRRSQNFLLKPLRPRLRLTNKRCLGCWRSTRRRESSTTCPPTQHAMCCHSARATPSDNGLMPVVRGTGARGRGGYMER